MHLCVPSAYLAHCTQPEKPQHADKDKCQRDARTHARTQAHVQEQSQTLKYTGQGKIAIKRGWILLNPLFVYILRCLTIEEVEIEKMLGRVLGRSLVF